jgi:hypothetical protein
MIGPMFSSCFSKVNSRDATSKGDINGITLWKDKQSLFAAVCHWCWKLDVVSLMKVLSFKMTRKGEGLGNH